MASILTGAFAVPFGMYLAGKCGNITLAFIAGAVPFLPLFTSLPKLI